MKKISLFFLCGSFLFLSPELLAKLQYRSATDIMSEYSEAFELNEQFFTKTSAFDQDGTELLKNEGSSFTLNDLFLRYTKGLFLNFEGSLTTNFRMVKSQSVISNASNSGFESLGLEGKYLLFDQYKFSHALGFHFKQALFKNTYYALPSLPPIDQIVLGDDGQEIGFNYYITYRKEYANYDFILGYNKPSSRLGSELNYNFKATYKLTDYILTAGIGGIFSLQNDPYSTTPDLKPAISRDNSWLFNSINREKNYLSVEAKYIIGDFILGLKGETIINGKYTDKGNALSLNIRWEKNITPSIIVRTSEIFQKFPTYFSEGSIEKVSQSGKMIRINTGLKNGLAVGTSIHVYSLGEGLKGDPIASGKIIEIGSNWSIVKIIDKADQKPMEVGFLVKAF